ncbi:MAG: hypothetical protein OEZ59_13935 [Deltaproteobacteria bacterium]|nr:hypothetical protein [Deltaproteobacteria bacterium]
MTVTTGKAPLTVGVFLAALAFVIFFLVSAAVAAPGERDRFNGEFRKWGRWHIRITPRYHSSSSHWQHHRLFSANPGGAGPFGDESHPRRDY